LSVASVASPTLRILKAQLVDRQPRTWRSSSEQVLQID